MLCLFVSTSVPSTLLESKYYLSKIYYAIITDVSKFQHEIGIGTVNIMNKEEGEFVESVEFVIADTF